MVEAALTVSTSIIRVCPVSRLIAPWILIRSRPLVCSIASFSCFGAQPPTGRAAWVGCTASTYITASSLPNEFKSFVMALDEILLLLHVELARNDIGLVIFEPQAMQQRDQPRTAFINEAEFPLDPGTDLARRARQRRADKGLQCVFLRAAQKARAPAHVEAGQALDSTLLEQLVPATDRVVVQQQCIGDFLTAPPVVQKHQGVGASGHSRRRRPIARQRDQLVAILFAEKAAANH